MTIGNTQNTLESLVNALSEAAKHEEPGDYMDAQGLIRCGKCKGRKQVVIQALGGEKVVWCACECQQKRYEEQAVKAKQDDDLRRIEELRRASLIEGRFLESRFENFIPNDDNRRILRYAKTYAAMFDEMYARNQGLLFFGNTSTGKTYTAACIANYLLDRMVPVVATSFVKLVALIKPFGGDEDSEEQVIRRINAAKLLIIDDLGAESGSRSELRKMYNVIDSRYRAGKPMIVTTNLTMNEIRNADDYEHRRIYERILETCYPVEFCGKSWRIDAARERFESMAEIFRRGIPKEG